MQQIITKPCLATLGKVVTAVGGGRGGQGQEQGQKNKK
jgi:hypothetical protein